MTSVAAAATATAQPDLKAQVTAAERAFSDSMARRDIAGFAALISEEAVFFGGGTVLRGRAAVVDGWARYFEGPQAPFTWEPDEVEVLASGTLAHSSGPVRDAGGRVALRFNSIWRLEAPGVWRVVFDKGSPLPAAP